MWPVVVVILQPRRDRNHTSRLSGRPGYLLRGDDQRRGPHLSADLHRYLLEDRLRQALFFPVSTLAIPEWHRKQTALDQ